MPSQRCTAVLLYYRFQYEEEVAKNPLSYDTWFDYVKLEEEAGDIDKVCVCPCPQELHVFGTLGGEGAK